VTSATSVMARELHLVVPLGLSMVCIDAQFLRPRVQPTPLTCPVKTAPAGDEIELQPPR
jgi:hypothetical protein